MKMKNVEGMDVALILNPDVITTKYFAVMLLALS